MKSLVHMVRNAYRILPDVGSISYEVYQGDGTFGTAATIPVAERRWLSQEAKQAEGIGVDTAACVFHTWKTHMGATVPKAGDRFTSDTEVWMVHAVTLELAKQRYRMTCIRNVS